MLKSVSGEWPQSVSHPVDGTRYRSVTSPRVIAVILFHNVSSFYVKNLKRAKNRFKWLSNDFFTTLYLRRVWSNSISIPMRLKRESKNGEISLTVKRLKTTISREKYGESTFVKTEDGGELEDSLSQCTTDSVPGVLNQIEMEMDVTKRLALDCEMVGVGICRATALARCSVVDYSGDIVCDLYVKPEEPVTDYRTKWSGIREGDLNDGITFNEARRRVRKIIEGCRLIGHAVHSDLRALNLTHPRHMIRDTAKYYPLRGLAGLQPNLTPSLKELTSILLGRTIQDSEHCSVEDARAAMSLYTLCELQWERELRGELSNQSYLSDLYWPSWTSTGCSAD